DRDGHRAARSVAWPDGARERARQGRRPTGGLDGRPAEPDRRAPRGPGAALRPQRGRDRARPEGRRCRRHGGRARAASGPEGPAAGRRPMTGFNISEWAIRHRALVAYFMIVFVVAGVGAYLKLGRSEDPDFTIKTMV